MSGGMANGGSARQNGPRRIKRFYRQASAAPGAGGFWGVRLDGKPVRTPARAPLDAPGEALAQALAGEWGAQAEFIDPVSMPLNKLANSAIDGVTGREAEVRADILGYAASDLVCYRAGHGEALRIRQDDAWDPLIAWMKEAYGAPFTVTAGLMPVPQPADAIARLEAAIAGYLAFELAALHSMTALTGSAIIAIACAKGRASAEEAWAAAHIDEDWQIAQWGEDAEAARRRAGRWREMQAAERFFRLATG